MATIDIKSLPPAEAVAFFRKKGFRFSFGWREVWQAEHARAFTVAKAMRLDILADIREAVDKALAEGQTFRQFQKDLEPILRQKGWWGRQSVTDPSGNIVTAQLGSPRRLRIIFDTNLRTAAAAGRWERIQRVKKRRPFLRYVTVLDERTRLSHRAWHGTVLDADHQWWSTHYPPNGWRCRCTVQQLSRRDLDRFGYEVSGRAPAMKNRTAVNARPGQAMTVPAGIDPGFAYNVGQAARQFDAAAVADYPILDPVRTWRDFARPRARDVVDRPASPKRLTLLSDRIGRGVSPEDARRQVENEYRRIFDIPEGRVEAAVIDPEGMQVNFNIGFLDYAAKKADGREAFLPHAKATVEDPFEIWLVPFRKRDGSVVMRKRYIGLFGEPDGRSEILVVVERHREGWGIWTAHPRRNIDRQRQGHLLFGK